MCSWLYSWGLPALLWLLCLHNKEQHMLAACMFCNCDKQRIFYNSPTVLVSRRNLLLQCLKNNSTESQPATELADFEPISLWTYMYMYELCKHWISNAQTSVQMDFILPQYLPIQGTIFSDILLLGIHSVPRAVLSKKTWIVFKLRMVALPT